eukprot:541618_1
MGNIKAKLNKRDQNNKATITTMNTNAVIKETTETESKQNQDQNLYNKRTWIIIPDRVPIDINDDEDSQAFQYVNKLPNKKQSKSFHKYGTPKEVNSLYDYFIPKDNDDDSDNADAIIIDDDNCQQNTKDFMEFNKKALKLNELKKENEKEKSSDVTSSDSVIYIGGADVSPCNFPQIIAEIISLKNSENKQDIIFHNEFKQCLNEFQMNEKEIINDYHNYGIGKGKIHKLVNPNKNLGSLLIDIDENYFNKNYHRWIPTQFIVGKLYENIQMTEIPNLDPYKYKYTLYDKFIPKLFSKIVPMFENILNKKLINTELKCIVKIQDYIINKQDLFEGGIHKDGLFENIAAIALYYYHMDENIIGGNLEIHSVIQQDDHYDIHGKDVFHTTVAINEGTLLVFDNQLCYHRVSKMRLNNEMDLEIGSRKIIVFFLIKPDNFMDDINNPDTSVIGTNWKYHLKR